MKVNSDGIDYENFQSPPKICEYMASRVPKDSMLTVLEPTPGKGNLVEALEKRGVQVYAPTGNFFLEDWEGKRYDYIVSNVPFSPMMVGYKILYKCMEMSDNIIALMPWLTLINSEKRTRDLMDFGLYSITHLPRNIFKGARVQTCILHLQKGYTKPTYFLDYNREV